MDIKVKLDDLHLIKSDSIFSLDNQKISVILDGKYTVKFSFKEDSTISGHKIDLNTSESEVEFILINFNNPIGTGLIKPIEFAKINGKPFYISFGVYAIASSKLLHYNLYIGE